MRTLLVLALALSGCYREAGPASAPPPSNKAAAPDHAREAEDELAFLPKESEIVVGVDLETLRASAAWREQIEPAIGGSASFAETRKLCGFDPWAPLTHLTIGSRKIGSETEIVAVVAGGDAKQEIACAVKQISAEYIARAEGDVTILSHKSGGRPLALAPIGRSHVLAFATPGVDATRVHSQMSAGAPLRDSPAFMSLYDKLERGASVWFILNGASPMFQSLTLGTRPRYIDGTLTMTDRYTLTARVTMASPGDANTLATTLRGVSAQAKQMAETFEIRDEGDVIHVDMVMTQPQMQTILAMFGSFAGP